MAGLMSPGLIRVLAHGCYAWQKPCNIIEYSSVEQFSIHVLTCDAPGKWLGPESGVLTSEVCALKKGECSVFEAM